MRIIINIFIVLTLLSASLAYARSNSKLKAYFNQYQGASYTDQYRGIKRKGHNLEAIIVREILRAKKSVFLAVQEIRLPAIAKALAQRKNDGLDIRVILENNYHNTIVTIKDPNQNDPNSHESSHFIEFFSLIDLNGDGEITKNEMLQRDAVFILENANIEIKDDTYDRSTGSGLMHHKYIVIDNKKVVVSSANFTMSGVHGDVLAAKSTGNANSLIVMESKMMAKYFTEEFFLMWGGEQGNKQSLFGTKKPYRRPRKTTVNTEEVVVQFSPTSKILNWNMTVNGLIGKELGKAKFSTHMALFVFSDQNLTNILKSKHELIDDFEMGLLIEPKFAYRSYSEMLDLWGLELLDEKCNYEQGNMPWKIPLYNSGVPKLARGDLLHHKFAVVDKNTVIIGSQNWSSSANYINDENLIVIKSESIARQYIEEYDRLSSKSRMGPTKSLLRKIADMERSCAYAH